MQAVRHGNQFTNARVFEAERGNFVDLPVSPDFLAQFVFRNPFRLDDERVSRLRPAREPSRS